MAIRVMHFSVLILAVTFVQSLYAVPLEPTSDNHLKPLVLHEADIKPEHQVQVEDGTLIRRARNQGVIFRPLFATRERDAEREAQRRRQDEAQRERQQRKEAQKQKRRAAAAASTASAQQYQQTWG